MLKCHTCELVAKRDDGTAPLWDNIYRTAYWDVVHSYNSALKGWLVLVSRRHIEAISEMTDEEALEMGRLIRQVSIILQEITGCLKTYVMQFAEHPQHPHVHFHIVPRMTDQPPEFKSTRIFEYLKMDESQYVSEEDMNEIARTVRMRLQELNAG